MPLPPPEVNVQDPVIGPNLLINNVTATSPPIQDSQRKHTSNPSGRIQQDIAIAVIGHTGCGKSSFISKLAEGDYTGVIAHDPDPNVHPLHEVECGVGDYGVLFLDTPGFDDKEGEYIVLQHIESWLRQYFNNKKLSGIVYMQSIGRAQHGYTALKSVQLIRKIIGQENMLKVTLLTTRWDSIGPNQPISYDRGTQVPQESDFRKGMIANGAKIREYDGTRKSAKTVILEMINDVPIQKTDTQEEKDKKLEEVCRERDRLAAEVSELKNKNSELCDELDQYRLMT
ncbi:hypothetical protein M434DRAFT_376920 [Hypoxylon sp. CO27-5]|nr:hypothetical protein M434DRAFT_376920 [Hypoxylon sp. CO27-5]